MELNLYFDIDLKIQCVFVYTDNFLARQWRWDCWVFDTSQFVEAVQCTLYSQLYIIRTVYMYTVMYTYIVYSEQITL